MAKHTQIGVDDVDIEYDSSRYSDWYVLFVQLGREEYMAEQCRRVLDDSIHARVFVPKYQVMMQFASVWEIRERILFPGYVFLETEECEASKLYVLSGKNIFYVFYPQIVLSVLL